MQIIVFDEQQQAEEHEVRALDALDAVFCTEHHVFHCRSGSFAQRHIEQIAAEQERCFRAIENVLEIPFERTIRYFLTDSPEENGRILEELFGMYAPGNGFAIGPNNVFAVYNEQIRCIGAHEVTHLVSYAFCKPTSEFLSEGLAMFMDREWWGKPNAAWVARFLADGRYLSVEALADDAAFWNAPCEITYPIAGAFTAYLIERLGTRAYLERIYKPQEPLAQKVQTALKKPLASVETDFLQWIGQNQ